MAGARLIKIADLPPQTWKNGGGVTYEIAADPPRDPAEDGAAAPKDFRWRISRALIERDGPFSVFPGMTRWILLLDGDGFTLSFAERAKLYVSQRFTLEEFPGASLAHCALNGGPCSVLNVIARQDVALRVNIARSLAPLPSHGHALVAERAVSIRLDDRQILQVAEVG